MLTEQLKVELRVYLRQPFYLLFSLLMPVMSFVIFGMMYKDMVYDGMNFFAAYIPGFSVIILFASSVYNIGNQVVGDKEKGIYKRLAVTPVSLKRVMTIVVFKAFLLAVLGFAIILFLAKFMFDVEFPNLLIYTLSYIIAIIYSLVLGFGAGMLTDKLNTYSAFMMVLFMPMFLLSDATIPLSTMPEILQKLSNANPLYHMNSVLRVAWDINVYKDNVQPFWTSIIFLIAFMVTFMVFVVIKWKMRKK